MNETQLTPRQNFILNIVNRGNGTGRLEIEKRVRSIYPASKPTIARDLSLLVRNKLVKTNGRSIATIYLPFEKNPLLNYQELEQYFSLEPDQRIEAKRRFDFSVFFYLKGLFGTEEITAFDGQINGGGGVDKFRIKIWDKDNNDAVVYDNQLGVNDNSDPTTVVNDGGSIVIHP